MSDAKADGVEEAPPKKKGKLFLFIGIGVLVLALVGAGAAFMLMKKKPADDEEGGDDEEKPHAAASHKDGKAPEAPVFVKLDPFTVRLQSEGTDSYLQAVPELRVLDAHVGEQVKNYMPEIRHKSLLVIAAKTPADVNNPKGVQALSDELRVTINAILAPPAPKKKKKKEVEEESSGQPSPDDPVQAVLFTSFIVQ